MSSHSKRQSSAFYQEYPIFAGRLLTSVSQTFHHGGTKPPQIPPGLAGLWVAAAAVMGLQQLLSLIYQYPELQQLLHDYFTMPEEESSQVELPLKLSSVLRRFADSLQTNEQDPPQAPYIASLEHAERSFYGLKEELQRDMLSQEEHRKEVESLFLQCTYTLTRLARM